MNTESKCIHINYNESRSHPYIKGKKEILEISQKSIFQNRYYEKVYRIKGKWAQELKKNILKISEKQGSGPCKKEPDGGSRAEKYNNWNEKFSGWVQQ